MYKINYPRSSIFPWTCAIFTEDQPELNGKPPVVTAISTDNFSDHCPWNGENGDNCAEKPQENRKSGRKKHRKKTARKWHLAEAVIDALSDASGGLLIILCLGDRRLLEKSEGNVSKKRAKMRAKCERQ